MVLSAKRLLVAAAIASQLTALLPPAALAQPAATTTGGEVTMPLPEYLELVRRAEAVRPAEPEVATVTRSRTRVRVDLAGATATTEVEVLVAGQLLRPLAIHVAGAIERARVEAIDEVARATRTAGADLGRQREQPAVLTLVARRAGRFRVLVESHLAGAGDRGARIALPPSGAPVAVAELDLPEAYSWRADGAIAVSEETSGGRRTLTLALPPDRETVVIASAAISGAPQDVLANTVAVTQVELGRFGWRRRDAVLYEVSRGALAAFEVEVPATFEVETAATEAGAVQPVEEARDGETSADGYRRVRFDRERPLEGIGFLRLDGRATMDPQRGGAATVTLPLLPLRPSFEPRARFLVLATDVAARLAPRPAAAWRRVDRADLPASIAEALPAAATVSVWREEGAAATETAVEVVRLEPAARLPALVRSRLSTTLLTPDGTLVQRERLELVSSDASLALVLPPNAVLWSAMVDGEPVRPLVDDTGSGARLRLPLSSEGLSTIEVISVQEGAVPPGRTELAFSTPSLSTPVLQHEWRILLPDGVRYRYVGGELAPARVAAVAGPPVGIFEGGGDATVVGTVRDSNGNPLPGALVTLEVDRARRVVLTDHEGGFAFARIETGRGRVWAELEGFVTDSKDVRVRSGSAVRADLVLGLGVSEAITVTSEAPRIDSFEVEGELDALRARQSGAEFADVARDLAQGTVGGVRPLEIEIPERGRLLLLSGALPPEQVGVRIEARRRR